MCLSVARTFPLQTFVSDIIEVDSRLQTRYAKRVVVSGARFSGRALTPVGTQTYLDGTLSIADR